MEDKRCEIAWQDWGTGRNVILLKRLWLLYKCEGVGRWWKQGLERQGLEITESLDVKLRDLFYLICNHGKS